MSVVRSAVRDRLNVVCSDKCYRPNPEGLYEPEVKDIRSPVWWRAQDGRVVKCVVPWLCHLPVHDYRVIFLLRDAEEIRQSYRAAFGTVGDNGLPRGGPTREEIEADVSEALQTLANRRDVRDVVRIHYREILGDPVGFFRDLDWPVNPERAAAVVDPALYRFRREKLVVGI